MPPVYAADEDFELDEIDLEELAEKIVALLLQEIEIENERTGR
jgi:hypothetical protein